MVRRVIAKMLGRTGTTNALLSVRRHAPSPWLTILTYHRAATPTPDDPFDDGVIDVTPAMFEAHLAFLKEWCSVLRIDDLASFCAGRPLPPNPVLITFDDGYLDNYETVYPLLTKYGLSAVFFVATSYIEERKLFWWDRVNYVMKQSKKDFIELEVPKPLLLDLRDEERSNSIRKCLRIVKDHFDLDLPRFLDDLARATGVNLSPEEERRMVNELLMNWDQVRALQSGGMEVQSHTVTHRVLQTLPQEKLDFELRHSRAVLGEVLGRPIEAVSYPVGKSLHLTPHIRRAVKAAGYDFGFSNSTGINHVWSFDPINARRLSLEVDLPYSLFRAMMAVPYVSYR